MENVWLMKTYKEWADRFLNTPSPFVALDEDGVGFDYATLNKQQRIQLFNNLKAKKTRRWGLIKRFFDQYYDEMNIDDLLILGTGQKTKFYVTAILRIKSDVNYFNTQDSGDSRHRRSVEILWKGDPFLADEWGWSNRLEKLDTAERLKQFIKLLVNLK